MYRINDPSQSIFSYLLDPEGVWVVCPKCHGPARSKIELTQDGRLPEAAKLACTGCSYRATSEFPPNPRSPICYGCGTRRIDRPDPRYNALDITPHNSRERCGFCRRLKRGYEPHSGLPFFLKTEIGGKELWALSHRHLADMRMFLGATLRERNPHVGLRLTAMARLPAWTKVASMRPKIVRSIDKMLVTAGRHGLL